MENWPVCWKNGYMARSPELAHLFQLPDLPAQRHYEICRAYFHDETPAAEIAQRLHLHVGSVQAIVRDFARDPNVNAFFATARPGRKTSPKRDAIHQRACKSAAKGPPWLTSVPRTNGRGSTSANRISSGFSTARAWPRLANADFRRGVTCLNDTQPCGRIHAPPPHLVGGGPTASRAHHTHRPTSQPRHGARWLRQPGLFQKRIMGPFAQVDDDLHHVWHPDLAAGHAFARQVRPAPREGFTVNRVVVGWIAGLATAVVARDMLVFTATLAANRRRRYCERWLKRCGLPPTWQHSPWEHAVTVKNARLRRKAPRMPQDKR